MWGSNYSVWKALTDGKGMESQLERLVVIKVKIYPILYRESLSLLSTEH